MKKWFIYSAAPLLSVSLLAACGGSDGDDGGSSESVEGETTSETIGSGDIELVFWEFGNTGYDKLIEEYVEENPDITINLQNSDMNDMHDNLFTSISADTGAPDIAMIEEAQIERYRTAEDSFNNLYDLGAGDVQDEFLDWVWNNSENASGDFVFGLPTDIGPTVMFYRTDVFEEAGFDSSPEAVSELIPTWDAYEEVAVQIYEETGKLMTDAGELIYNARRDQASQQYFNTDEELIIDDHPEIREAYDYTADFFDQDLAGDIPLWTPEWFAGMADGSYATMLAPAWMQGVIKDNSPEEGIWSITTMPEGAGNWGGSFLTIPSESEHAEEAYAFISWLTAPEQQLKSFLDYGLFPSAPAVYEMDEFINYEDAYFGGIPTAQVFSEAAQQVIPVYKGRNYYSIDDVIKEAIDNVSAGDDRDEEWSASLDTIDRILAR
ncbi:ABC transporter substrate-binding protein [Shouchella lehensis]|uniref:Extracellular solute-binding transporter n=2 Tax=Shouchella lehensis TaxID=300825 RepID=A0A060LYJ0_9BACI|nr:extracellular solute-binding protein [Shouchella lehensis]AIC93353.1 extracellular solute-binding transporter [Shouchella lehensis G1]MBG9782894.1 sugar transporter [Shouchella lehensis]RQW22922.1 extracellular solute-binding protein [Bacillus sp. C1-1]TES49755.1 extracellular solute-binding protein [Shouchella lehensis]